MDLRVIPPIIPVHAASRRDAGYQGLHVHNSMASRCSANKKMNAFYAALIRVYVHTTIVQTHMNPSDFYRQVKIDS